MCVILLYKETFQCILTSRGSETEYVHENHKRCPLEIWLVSEDRGHSNTS